jgi:small GTP-binding protein
MDYRAKISLIGDEMTGKTSLILRYIKNSFTNEYITTLGADFVDKTYTHDDLEELNPGDEFTLTIWDMAGQSHFKEIAKIYCEGSAGMIIVFDANNHESFLSIPKWFEFAQTISYNGVIQVIGNKIDLPRQIEEGEIKKMEKKLGITIHFTSAAAELEDEISNVGNIFKEMAAKIFRNHDRAKNGA